MDWKIHLYVTFTTLETSALIFYDETTAEQPNKRGGSKSVSEGKILFPKAQTSLDLRKVHKCCLSFCTINLTIPCFILPLLLGNQWNLFKYFCLKSITEIRCSSSHSTNKLIFIIYRQVLLVLGPVVTPAPCSSADGQ